MKYILSVLFLLTLGFVHAQMSDSFDDGDITSNPTWVGDVDDFIVNSAGELQLNASGAGVSYLSTPHNLTEFEDKEWRFKINYGFAGSNSNYGLTYLIATSSDLSALPDGIYFRIGEAGSNDPIELIQRIDELEVTFLTSTPGIVASSFNITVRIIYRANGEWELYYDENAGEDYLLDATTYYPITTTGDHLGIWLKYTASNATRFRYDDFYAGNIIVDTIPPVLDTVYATSTTQLVARFNEGLDPTSAEQLDNYLVNLGIGNPSEVELDVTNPSKVMLTFGTPFVLGQVYEIEVKEVEDLEGNPMETSTKTFLYIEAETPEWGDIVINEFLPRVTPSVGLPEYQFVELYNRSDKYLHLDGWKLSDNNSSGTIGDAWLFPGEYIVLIPASAAESYPTATVVSGWAQLNLTGDEIHLETPDGFLVDELTYTNNWYKDEDKKMAGWSIERINPDLACSGADNWRASVHPNGGTPGEENSVFDNTPDTEEPSVLDVVIISDTSLKITFSEMMDSLSLMNADFTASYALVEEERQVSGRYPTEIIIVFEEIEKGVAYSFTFGDFSDCSGNSSFYEGEFLVPQTAELGDLIINEILFNPLTGGSDFVEIYNRSERYIDLIGWELANSKDDTIANHKAITYNYILAPKDYVVITKDSTFQLMNYPMAVPGKFIEISALPAYNNDESTVYLIYNDTVMDEVSYDENWHFSLLNSKKGVSLERFSADEPSNSPANWHSASETVGFATPGGQNSQAMFVDNTGGTITLSSNTFSPDGDGFEDVLLIHYEVSGPDLLGDLVVYDDKGRKIKTLMERELLGQNGTIKWEGTRDDGTKASIGPHIILFEVFDLNSAKVHTVRKVVTLAGRL